MPVQKKNEWSLIFSQCNFLSFQTLKNAEVVNTDLMTDLFDIFGIFRWFSLGGSKVLCNAVVVTGSLGTGLWICVA